MIRNVYSAVVTTAFVCGSVLFATSCATADKHSKHGDMHKNQWAKVTKAICVIQSTKGNSAQGVITFTQTKAGVKVVADITGLTPGKKHGFHIHEYGDISGSNGKSAGGHYNPEGHDHAGPGTPKRHAGDMGNLTADAKGKAHLELTLENCSVAGLKNPIVGRGVIVHEGTDDMKSQPTGAAGARIGMGVIGIAK